MGAPTPPSWSTACAPTRTGWSWTSWSCSIRTVDRLEVVGGLAGRILRRRGWAGDLVTTDDRQRAIDGADFVVVQLRVGGQAARHTDETLPIGYGCLGQETTGPGGLAKALRTVPLVLEIAEETADAGSARGLGGGLHQPGRHRDPGAGRRRATAPSVCATWPSTCSGASATTSGWTPTRSTIEHVGLNHLTWVRSAVVDGVDRMPELLDRFGPELELESGVPAGLLRLLGALPSYYLHYYYCLDQNLAEQAGPGLAVDGPKWWPSSRPSCSPQYRDPRSDTKPKKLSYRGGRLLLGGGGPADRLAPRRHRRRPGRGRPQRRVPCPGYPMTPWSRSPARWTGTAPTRCPSGRCRRTWRAWWPTARPTSDWPWRRPVPGAGRP